jgi:hypothetical protein
MERNWVFYHEHQHLFVFAMITLFTPSSDVCPLNLSHINLSRSPSFFLSSSHKILYSLSKNRRKVLNVSLLPLPRTNHGIQTCLSSSSTSFQNPTLLLRMSLSIRFPPLAEITRASTWCSITLSKIIHKIRWKNPDLQVEVCPFSCSTPISNIW